MVAELSNQVRGEVLFKSMGFIEENKMIDINPVNGLTLSLNINYIAK